MMNLHTPEEKSDSFIQEKISLKLRTGLKGFVKYNLLFPINT